MIATLNIKDNKINPKLKQFLKHGDEVNVICYYRDGYAQIVTKYGPGEIALTVKTEIIEPVKCTLKNCDWKPGHLMRYCKTCGKNDL